MWNLDFESTIPTGKGTLVPISRNHWYEIEITQTRAGSGGGGGVPASCNLKMDGKIVASHETKLISYQNVKLFLSDHFYQSVGLKAELRNLKVFPVSL